MWNTSTIWVAWRQMMQYVHLKLNPGLPWQTQHSTRRRFTPGDVNLGKKLVQRCNWSITLYCHETLTLREVDQKYMESFEMWWWGRMEKDQLDRSWRNEVLHRIKKEGNIRNTISRMKGNWTGHILRRNYLLKHVIEGKTEGRIEMTGRRRQRRRQPLDNLEEMKGYYKLKEEAIFHALWRTLLEQPIDLS